MKIRILLLFLLCGTAAVPEELHNGIVLPEVWPPAHKITAEPMAVPYLRHPPQIIPIDRGRQLFVDDFLIQETTLQRSWHRPRFYEGNPVIKPEKKWESSGAGAFAAPFSGGVWYDPYDKLFKIWYTCGYLRYTCYATSNDGIHWNKPQLDIVPGTNIVIDHTRELKQPVGPEQERRPIDTSSVWIDYKGDPLQRYRIFYTSWSKGEQGNKFHLFYGYSKDGIHWSKEPIASSNPVGDHTNAHYNPFRDKWVIQVRDSDPKQGRARSYVEDSDPAQATRLPHRPQSRTVPWLAADRLDPRNPNPDRGELAPQLYQVDTIAYESLTLGYFSIWQGPDNRECERLHIHKRNEVLFGYSRDGFHYDRPDRRPAFNATEAPGAWNWGNIQSAGGACLIVGDRLYLYFSGRGLPEDKAQYDMDASTGLAFLRRDGFASMDSFGEAGSLTTRPVRFRGRHLFVNSRSLQGELRVEVLDANGAVIAPFSKERCDPIRGDRTLRRVTWQGAPDLANLVGRAVRFKFYVRLGELYSFWVSPDLSGASYGYVGAGGPGHAGFVDREGDRTSR